MSNTSALRFWTKMATAAAADIGPVDLFGFSWRRALSLRKPPIMGLDFLGFPWILSSESRLINWLRGINRHEFFSRSIGLGQRRAAAHNLPRCEGWTVPGGEFNRRSDFLHSSVVRAITLLPTPPKAARF